MSLPRVLTEPPLRPDGDEARSVLGRELAKPEYHDTDVIEQIQRWLDRLFARSADYAADQRGLTTFIAILVALLIVVAIVVLASRFRRAAAARDERGPVLTEPELTATELRECADAALAAGRYDDALLDGYRALALRQIEKRRIEDLPQATAHELARVIAEVHTGRRGRLHLAADLFDAVLYGGHPARHDQAAAVLLLDDELGSKVQVDR